MVGTHLKGFIVGDAAISFCIAVFTCVGTIFWVVYGAYGLGSLPVYILKGNKSLTQAKTEVITDLAKIREKYRGIQEKYARSHSKISKTDQRSLNNLKRQEKSDPIEKSLYTNRMLDARGKKIDESQIGSLQTIFAWLAPFRVVVGLVCLAFSLIILTSFAITSVDRIQHSTCGFSCGFMIEKPSYVNPLDHVLVWTSKYFPMDYMIFSLFVFYISISCLYGMVKVGIKFLWFTVLAFKSL